MGAPVREVAVVTNGSVSHVGRPPIPAPTAPLNQAAQPATTTEAGHAA
jgi:hypothetical protein